MSAKRPTVGVDFVLKFNDKESTEYKCHLEVPREDVDRLKNLVGHYVNMATMFPQLLRTLIARLK